MKRILLIIALILSIHLESIATPVTLHIIERSIEVNGKKARVYGITQPDGTFGFSAKKGDEFNVHLVNTLQVPTSVHWHGIILPNNQDGVAFITQLPIYPGLAYDYRFPILQSGTFFMHSHYSLQEQLLLTAPLIFTDSDDLSIADREAVIMFNDFSFTPPKEIYENLRCRKKPAMKMQAPDIVEVNYDAFLANYRTLESPEIINVKPDTKVRLRLINSSSATNFLISLENLEGEAIAADGNRIHPLPGKHFELGVAQRIDILVTIPKEGGRFPILAQGEGTDKQTGVILATEGAPPIETTSYAKKIGPLTNIQESKISALTPLPPKEPDQKLVIELGGDMATYTWTLNGQSWPDVTPIIVEKGQRIEITYKNMTSMTHPMHLHGHVFQVVGMNAKKINGAVRDTVLVTPNSTVTIAFDADNPGVWPLHCHVLYHLEAGMLTVVRYKDFIQPL